MSGAKAKHFEAGHEGCARFSIDLDCDPYAIPLLYAYADLCVGDHPAHADMLRRMARGLEARRATLAESTNDEPSKPGQGEAMGKETNIPWADSTFNVVWGCEEVSPGCLHCYAREWAHRFGYKWGKLAPRRTFPEKHWKEPLSWNRKAKKEERRIRIMCSSMCDVFEDHPTVRKECDKLWPLIDKCDHSDFLLITKRPQNAVKFAPLSWRGGWPDNVWIVSTIENQAIAPERMEALLSIPAKVRGVSAEPLLTHLDLTPWLIPKSTCCGAVVDQGWCPTCDRPTTARHGLDWLICGGESEEKMGQARPFRASWAKSLRDQCAEFNVAFYMKQLGSNFVYDTNPGRYRCQFCAHRGAVPPGPGDRRTIRCENPACGKAILPTWNVAHPKGEAPAEFPATLQVREFPLTPFDVSVSA